LEKDAIEPGSSRSWNKSRSRLPIGPNSRNAGRWRIKQGGRGSAGPLNNDINRSSLNGRAFLLRNNDLWSKDG